MDKLENAESAMTTSAYWLNNALTAPILLPQTATLNPFYFKNLTAISTSFDSYLPREMNFFYILLPQPLKSKQANPTFGGSRLS
jgi:hypothetical protein